MNNPEFQPSIPMPGHPETKEFLRHMDWTLKTDLEEVDKPVGAFEQAATEYGWSELDRNRISASLIEALENAMVQGNLQVPRDTDGARFNQNVLDALKTPKNLRLVHLSIEISIDRIQIIIEDAGGAKTPEALKQIRESFLNRDATDQKHLMEEYGRGGTIINAEFGQDGIQIEPYENKEENRTGLRLILTKTRDRPETKNSTAGETSNDQNA